MEVVAAEGVGADGAEDAGALADEGLTEGTTGEAADTGSTEEPELFTVKIDGREEQVTLDEALKGHMRQADYTRKSQELARQRQEVSQYAALAAALERDPRTTLVSLASALGVDLGTAAQVASAIQEDADPLDRLSSKVDSLASTLTAQQQQAAQAAQQAQQVAAFQAQIEQETVDLKARYGDFAERELYQYAVDHNIATLEAAFGAWQFEMAEAKKIAERNAAVAAKRRAQVVSGGANSAPGSVTSNASTGRISIREAYLAAANAQ